MSIIIKIVCILHLALFAIASNYGSTSTYGTASDYESPRDLQSLHVISRHGARTPYSMSYPGDPNKGFLAFGKGQLTQKGTLQMFEYGKTLKKRYNNFIGTDYRKIYAFSSYVTRCIQSGHSMLAALYPSLVSPIATTGHGHNLIQPIPIYTAPRECAAQILLPAGTDSLLDINKLFSPSVQKELVDRVTRVTGIQNATFEEIFMWSDAITSEKFHNLPIPPWYEQLEPTLEENTIEYFRQISTSTIYSIPLAGKLLKEIVSNLEDGRNTTDTDVAINAFYYFTHDAIVSALLGLLRVPLALPPPFGATVLIEKFGLGYDTRIRFLYLDSAKGQPRVLLLPGCDEYLKTCTLTQFKEHILIFYKNIL